MNPLKKVGSQSSNISLNPSVRLVSSLVAEDITYVYSQRANVWSVHHSLRILILFFFLDNLDALLYSFVKMVSV